MAEESEGSDAGAEASGAGVDPFAAAMALGGASRERADAFLKKQEALIEDQRHHLREQFKLLRLGISEKRWGVFLRVATAIVGVAVAAGLALIIWDAAHANGLIIESFSVPPDMASRGLGGQVVAGQMLDQLTTMAKEDTASRPAQSYANSWGSDVKVEIPDTGVSVGEAYRFLRAWLGHDIHVTGEVYHTATGIAVTARTGADPGGTFLGAESDLDSLIQKAAEHVYGNTQPYRFAIHLYNLPRPVGEIGRSNEARTMFTRLTSDPVPLERAWAWIGLYNISFNVDGNLRAGVSDLYKAASLGQNIPANYENLGTSELNLGHAEAALAADRTLDQIVSRSAPTNIAARGITPFRVMGRQKIAFLLGDYTNAVSLGRSGAEMIQIGQVSPENFMLTAALSLARQHDGIGARAYWRALPPAGPSGNRPIIHLQMDAAMEDWQAVVGPDASVEKTWPTDNPLADSNANIGDRVWPFLALAKARSGDTAGAEALIARTPADCYDCTRMRGNIASAEGSWGPADTWFAKAVHDGPSIPFAETDWGQSMLARGKADDAIAKFTLANQKGPKFADPLEGWGEALMKKNQSHLALAKFEEAEKYAPNWGRLHLKWGEALGYAGRKDEAQKQYALAAGLYMSAADKAELARQMQSKV